MRRVGQGRREWRWRQVLNHPPPPPSMSHLGRCREEANEKGHPGWFCSVSSCSSQLAGKGVSSHWGTFHPLLVLKSFLLSKDSPQQKIRWALFSRF